MPKKTIQSGSDPTWRSTTQPAAKKAARVAEIVKSKLARKALKQGAKLSGYS